MIALWLRLTRSTVAVWVSIDCPRWMTPSPPSSAIVSAILRPVTLSMLDETMGNSSERLDVNGEVKGIWDLVGAIPFCGRNRKSSNVLPIQAGSNCG